MDSLHDIDAVHWDHEPRCTAGSAGILPASRCFRVERQNRPAGRRRSQARFIQSRYDFTAVQWDREPTPNPSQAG